MEKHEGKQEYEWIEKVKSLGAVPIVELDHRANGWASPPGSAFMLRGPEYVKTKAKIPGGDYFLKPLGFDWIKAPTKISQLLNDPKNHVRKALEEQCSKGHHKPFVWAFNLQLPARDYYSIVAYFVDLEPRLQDSLINRFLNGDDGFKNSRLKLIVNVVKGPWAVRKAIGDQAICLIGRALTCSYSAGENFIQVDIDVGSSVVAAAIFRLAFGYFTTMTVDLAFLIEGQTESELPERILGAVRFSMLDAASARQA